jgi:3-methyl-2-oxobutanoate hydroxymethyltransferase
MNAHVRERVAQLSAKKRNGEPLVMITAHDYPSGQVAEAAGVDFVLVGDSAGMTVLGYPSTRDVSLEEMLILTKATRRGVATALLVGDLPFGTYEASDAQALATARRFVEEASCDLVKLEGAGERLTRVRTLTDAGIGVVGHVGLLPQEVAHEAEYRVRGRLADEAMRIIADAELLERAGCVALVVEAVPAEVGALIARTMNIPVIGIGAGPDVDGQVLVLHDLLGLSGSRVPRFVRRYASLRDDMVSAVGAFARDVRSGAYPAPEHTYRMTADEWTRLRALRGHA